MKVNLDWYFKRLDGKSMTEDVKAKSEDEGYQQMLDNIHAGRNVASILGGARENDNIIKFWEWAQAFYKKDSVELDKSDFTLLRGFVEKNQTLSLLAKAQVILALDAAKEAADKPKKS